MDFNCSLKREKCFSARGYSWSFLFLGRPFPRSGWLWGQEEAPAVCPRQLRASNLPVWTHKIKDPPGVLIKNAKLGD